MNCCLTTERHAHQQEYTDTILYVHPVNLFLFAKSEKTL